MKYTYLLINLGTVLVPFIFSFHPKIKFNRYFIPFLIADLLVAIPFLIWDVLFTEEHIWGFNEKYVSGIYVFGLPVEEILFFLCIPFACMFTYHCLTKFFNLKWWRSMEIAVTVSLISTLTILAVLNSGKAYTFTTFTTLVIFLFAFVFITRSSWVSQFYSVYLILLVPFLIVNGILTGTGLGEPIVWYDESNILGPRILSIPVEDIFYGMELILLNLFLFKEIKTMININRQHQLGNFYHVE